MTNSTTVLQYMEQRRGINIFIDDMARDLNLDRKKVISAVNALRRNAGVVIESPTKGCYRYVGDAPAAIPDGKRLFEELATTKDGRLLIQDEDGNVFMATAV